MGDDFTNHQVFAGDGEPHDFRRRLIQQLKHCLVECGFAEIHDENQAQRSIAVGPPGRWVCVYDSYGNGDDARPAEFEQLSLLVSNFAPVVDVHMEDNAALQFYLYDKGRRQDQFANILRVSGTWANQAERERFKGRAGLWKLFLGSKHTIEQLRSAWDTGYADQILSSVAALFGWDEVLCRAGFTVDYDGIPVFYKEHLEDEPVDPGAFDELYFQRTAR